MAHEYKYQGMPTIRNQWLLAFKMVPKQYVHADAIFTLYANNEQQVNFNLNSQNNLILKLRFNAFPKMKPILDPLPLNEITTITVNRIYDTFRELHIYQFRVNGTLIVEKPWNKLTPLSNVSLWCKENRTPMHVNYLNLFVLEIP